MAGEVLPVSELEPLDDASAVAPEPDAAFFVEVPEPEDDDSVASGLRESFR
ncbi:hypothetical protein BH23CHL9_BH23CHL9_06210 [soil metagenome]